MALQGDLSTLDLAALLQNLEAHERTGTLTIDGEQGAEHLYFKAGKLALYATPGRPALTDVLVACGRLSAQQLDAARTERKGTRRSLGETLVAMQALSAEDLAAVATSRLIDDACELVGSGSGAFRFKEGSAPRGVFDPEERRLGLALAPGLILLEAARRSDHWQMIKSRIPSASAHYLVLRAPRPGAVGGDAQLCTALLERLDGTRSVAEVLSAFPHRRFESYQLIADLLDARAIRLVSADDIARLAREATERDAELAWNLVKRGLQVQPDHAALLATLVELADARGEPEAAGEALKVLAHQRLEAGDRDGAREVLARAKEVDPSDRAVWQKSLTLAIEEDRREDAIADGRHLGELFHAAGLERKACLIFEQLVELDPQDWQFRSRLAHSRADCGEIERAVGELAAYGKGLLEAAEYERARVVFCELRSLDPTYWDAQQTIEDIDSGLLERRRARRQRAARLLGFALLTAAWFSWLAYEMLARNAYREALRTVSERDLVETRDYAAAGRIFADMRAAFPFSTTALWDAEAQIELLEEKAERSSIRLTPVGGSAATE